MLAVQADSPFLQNITPFPLQKHPTRLPTFADKEEAGHSKSIPVCLACYFHFHAEKTALTYAISLALLTAGVATMCTARDVLSWCDWRCRADSYTSWHPMQTFAAGPNVTMP